MKAYHQKLPSSGPEREVLRQKGQFWTPDWVADAMVGYILAGGSQNIYDPAVGAGAFFRAAQRIASELGRPITLLGMEIDRKVLQQARQNGIAEDILSQVQIADFAIQPPSGLYRAIVANPPYIRHHRLSNTTKSALRAFGGNLIGRPLDGRAGLHIYFLLRSLQLLDKDGRLAFIMPADTCEGIFSSPLWKWITGKYCLDAVVTFAPEASPFPGVDTNPLIFLIRSAEPADQFLWAKCMKAQTKQLKAWMLSSCCSVPDSTLLIYPRSLAEGIITGLSRPPQIFVENETADLPLSEFAKVKRGIATGANHFFSSLPPKLLL